MKEDKGRAVLNGLEVVVTYSHNGKYENIEVLKVVEPFSQHDMTDIISGEDIESIVNQLS